MPKRSIDDQLDRYRRKIQRLEEKRQKKIYYVAEGEDTEGT